MPRQHATNVRWRLKLYAAAKTNPALQAGLIELCRQDLAFWINAFVWQYNPNSIGEGSEEIGPFVTWEFQEELLDDLRKCVAKATRRDALMEKSREMGLSWLLLLLFLHAFLFEAWKKFLVISRNADAVDKPDEPDSLFWKLDFVIEQLPSWMNGGRVSRRKMGFKNPLTKSTITGQASTGKAGVGGRATAMLIDEFSQIDEDFEVLHRTSDTSSCRLFNGTHRGLDTAFYELSQRVDMHKLIVHWSQHPDKKKGLYRYNAETNQVEVLDKQYAFPPDFEFVMDGSPTGGPFPGLRSPWYDKECRRKGSSRAIAMDLDIDPKGSVSQFFDPILIRTLQGAYAADPYWEGDLDYDKETGKPRELVARVGGPIKMWVQPDIHGRIPSGVFAAGADVATGSGATNSCFCLGDARTSEKILEYANPNIDEQQFAVLCVALCRLFASEDGEGALFAWETPGPGYAFGRKVIALGYRNVYYRADDFKVFSAQSNDVPGWHNAPNSCRLLLEEYREALRTRLLMNRSWFALEETLAFKYTSTGVEHGGLANTEDPTGAKVNHGDRTMGDALMWKMMVLRGAGQTREEAESEEPPQGSLAWRRALRENVRRKQAAWI